VDDDDQNITQPNRQERINTTTTTTSSKQRKQEPWFCVSRPIHDQTRDIPIRSINRSSSIQTNRLLQQCHSMLKFCIFREDIQEVDQTNISKLNHNHHWGDSLPSDVKGKTIRIVYQNVHRSLSASDNPHTTSLLDNLKMRVWKSTCLWHRSLTGTGSQHFSGTNCGKKSSAYGPIIELRTHRVIWDLRHRMTRRYLVVHAQWLLTT